MFFLKSIYLYLHFVMTLHNWFYNCSKGVLDATARVIFSAVGGLIDNLSSCLLSLCLLVHRVQLKRRKIIFITWNKHQFSIIFNLFYSFKQYIGIKTPTVRCILESICLVKTNFWFWCLRIRFIRERSLKVKGLDFICELPNSQIRLKKPANKFTNKVKKPYLRTLLTNTVHK